MVWAGSFEVGDTLTREEFSRIRNWPTKPGQLDFGTITQTMFWHPRLDSDPAPRWVRGRISALAAGL